MGSLTAPLDFTLSDLQRSNSRSRRFGILISHKGAYLGPMLPLKINRKPYMGTPNVTPSKMKLKGTQIAKAYIS